jgi:hypothetical protein
MKFFCTVKNPPSAESLVKKLENCTKWVMQRNKLSFDLLEQFRENKRRQKITPESRFAELYLDGVYHGLYLLSEQVTDVSLGLEEYDYSEPSNSAVYYCTDWNGEFIKSNAWNRGFPANFLFELYNDFPRNEPERYKCDDPITGRSSGHNRESRGWIRL